MNIRTYALYTTSYWKYATQQSRIITRRNFRLSFSLSFASLLVTKCKCNKNVARAWVEAYILSLSLFLTNRRKIGQLILTASFSSFRRIGYISNNFKAVLGPVSLTQRDIIARMLPSRLFPSLPLSFTPHTSFSFPPFLSPNPNFAAPSNPTIASRFFHVTVIANCSRFRAKDLSFKFPALRYTFLARILLFQLHLRYRHLLRVETDGGNISEKTIDTSGWSVRKKRFRLSFRMEERRHVTRNLFRVLFHSDPERLCVMERFDARNKVKIRSHALEKVAVQWIDLLAEIRHDPFLAAYTKSVRTKRSETAIRKACTALVT